MDQSECPFKPGTPEWRAWQRESIEATKGWMKVNGGYGATAEQKRAAGLPELPTVRGRNSAPALSQWPEPWRAEVVKRMWVQVPGPDDPVRLRGVDGEMFITNYRSARKCPWCGRRWKRTYAFEAHVRRNGACSPHHPNWVGFRRGMYEPFVRMDGKMMGYVRTDLGDAATEAGVFEEIMAGKLMGPIGHPTL